MQLTFVGRLGQEHALQDEEHEVDEAKSGVGPEEEDQVGHLGVDKSGRKVWHHRQGTGFSGPVG